VTDAEMRAFEAGYRAAAPMGHSEEHLAACMEMDYRHYEVAGHDRFIADIKAGIYLFGPGPSR